MSKLTFIAAPGGPVVGEARVPGDKSISHRAIMLGSIASGTTQVSGFLEGEDSLATLQAFRAMGVEIVGPEQGHVTIKGAGKRGLRASADPLYLGNSGTSMRLLAGLLAGQSFASTLSGDASLSTRPMRRVTGPLQQMGASITTAAEGVPPIRIEPTAQLQAIHYDLPIASAQVKSCLLLAGLYARGRTSVTEPAPTRDHTERMLRGFAYPVEVQGSTVSLEGGGELKACNIDVPADISSAAFFLVAASICPGSDLLLRHVGINPTRIGVLNILRLMGADLELLDEREVGGEPVADIRVRYAPLQGIEIPEDQVALAIDEFPVLFIAAANASGQTVLRGAGELRVKESDRIQVMADGMQALGINALPTADGIVIEGCGGSAAAYRGGRVDSHGDHRIAMAFAVAALRAADEIRIADCANVATSFPGFMALANGLGFTLKAVQADD